MFHPQTTTPITGPYLCPSNVCFTRTGPLTPAEDTIEQIAVIDPREINPELVTSSLSVTNEYLRSQLSVITAKIDVLEGMLKEGLPKIDKEAFPRGERESLPTREQNGSKGSLNGSKGSLTPTKRSPWGKLKPSTIAKVQAIGRLSLMAKRMHQTPDEILSNNSSMSNHSHHSQAISEESKPTPASTASPPASDGSGRRGSFVSSLASMFGKIRSSYSNSHQSSETTRRIRETIRASRTSAPPMSRSVYIFMERPNSSVGAFIYSRLMNAILFCSIVVSLLQTVDSDEGNILSRPEWEIAQITSESAFAVELLMRLLAYHDKRHFLTLFNMIDLVAVLMLAMRAVLGAVQRVDTDAYRTFRSIVPLVCCLKLLRRFEKVQLLLTAFRVALNALPVLLYTMLLIIIFFADLMYLVERDNMKDLPTALWFTTVTISTVGYGDIAPNSWGGRLVASALIYVSALYMAIPIGIVGNAFSQVWADRDRLLVKQRFKSAFIQEGFTTTTMQAIFRACDADGSGEIDVEQFVMMLELMEIDMSAERMRLLFAQLDKHDEGRIKLEDVIDIFAPYQSVKKFWSKYSSALSYGASTDKLGGSSEKLSSSDFDM